MSDLVKKIKEKVNLDQYRDIKRVVLAYSGGLDTSVMIKLVRDLIGAEVITLTIDVGQQRDLKEIERKAKEIGASKTFTLDAKREFAEEFIFPSIKANCIYEGAYPNSTALSRPLIAKYLVEIAGRVEADAVMHGSTGKGNDQVRFDLSVAALNPNLKVIAPVRDWEMARDDEIEYARENNIPVSSTKSVYSVDENLWGRSIECGILEHPGEQAPRDVYSLVTPPEESDEKPGYVTIYFEKGVPVRVVTDEKSVKEPVEMIEYMNTYAGKRGVGFVDHMEDRVVGLKSREIYEVPAALTFLAAHRDLEKYVFTRDENEFKPVIDKLWGELVYKALWYSPLKKELDAFIDKSQERVEGWVKVKLYKGVVQPVARDSPYALYDFKLATYGKESTYTQKDALGFIRLYGLNTILASKVMRNVKGKIQ